MKKKLYIGLLSLALAILAVVGAHAQGISGDLVGTAFDKSGALVPSASVEVVNVETNAKYSTVANNSGEFRFTNLPVGTYNITVSAPGFASTVVNGFRIELNKTSTLPVTLEVKGTVATVEVTSEAPALDTTTTTLATTYEAKELADLPSASVGAGVLNLSLLDSGVASSGGVGAGSGPSVGGQRPRNNNFTIEGVDNNSKSVTGPLVYVPNDAVAEFSVLQNQYSPEFGHSSGGQFNQVVKGGTNVFHGLAYIYSQNRNFNAIDQSTINSGFTSNQRYDNNRIGGSLGGPIFKNKLFFYTTLEYNPIGSAAPAVSATCTPTAAGYTTLSQINGLSQTNLGILQKFVPAAPSADCPYIATATPGAPTTVTVANTPVLVGVLPISPPNFTNNWDGVVSIDYNMSEKNQFRGRYIYNRSDGIDTAASLPVFFTTVPNHLHLVTIGWYHTFNSKLSNEFRVGFNRLFQDFPAGNFSFPGLDSFPNLSFDELGLQVGPDPNAPQFGIQNVYSAVDNLTWTQGHHSFKFGFEGRKYISPQSFTQRARGDYDYGTLDLYLRDLTPDSLGERSLGNPVYYGDQTAWYWYANDNWRIRTNLTLNVGVRYEYTTIPFGERSQKLNQAASVPGLIDFSEPRPPKNNWGPRIGLVYSPGSSGNTAIRAGFGMSYDVLYDNIGILSLPPQLSGTVDCTLSDVPPINPACPVQPGTTGFLAKGGIPPSPGGLQTFPDIATQREATSNHIVVDQKSPVSAQWTLGIQHTFAKDFTAEVRYLGTHGYHLNVQQRINRQPLTNSTVFLPTYLANPGQAALDALPYTRAGIAAGLYGNGDSFVPAYGNAGFTNSLVQFSPDGGSSYHGLATQLTKRMAHGLQFQAAYTLSKTIDDSTADFFTTILTPRRPQDFRDLKADRGTSALDRRHRFTLALIYDVPYFKSGNWLQKNVLGNWEIAPVYTYQSPEYATVQSARDVNGNGDSWGDRVIFNPAGKSGTGSDVKALTNTAGDVVAYLAKDPTAQYIRGGQYSRPNTGRNTLPTRHINNFDMTALKRLSFTERFRTEFSVGAFNLFNHPQFVPGSLNNINSIGYTSNSIRTYLTPGKGNFNDPESVFASNARTLQLGLKFIF